MQIRKVCFRVSIIAALAIWVIVSSTILGEVIESRKNTIAARQTGFIQEDLKAAISTRQVVASEPIMVAKVFGLILLDTAAVWTLLWMAWMAVRLTMYGVRQLGRRLYTSSIRR